MVWIMKHPQHHWYALMIVMMNGLVGEPTVCQSDYVLSRLHKRCFWSGSGLGSGIWGSKGSNPDLGLDRGQE